MTDYTQPLRQFQPQHDFFIGIDSDGCAFDSMEIKHKECFIPNIIKYWNLQPVSKYAREAAEFVNLYSKWRGINRWPALVMVFDLLRERPAVQARTARAPCAPIPEAKAVREFIANLHYPKSDSGLKAYLADYPNPELETALAWSTAVNQTIEEIVHGLQPFPYLPESLATLVDKTDMMVVSATPQAALEREWAESGIAQYVRLIAGQELGSKKEHLLLATKGKYSANRVLMIGDAPGDLQAAKANEALFFPINPGAEEESWQRFYEEGLHQFLAGNYAGAYQAARIAEFERLLPDTPPWKQGG